MLQSQVLPAIQVRTLNRYTGELGDLVPCDTQTEAELYARKNVSLTTNVMVFYFDGDWCFKSTCYMVDRTTEQVVSRTESY